MLEKEKSKQEKAKKGEIDLENALEDSEIERDHKLELDSPSKVKNSETEKLTTIKEEDREVG